jgi:hypothetical protein
MFIQIYNHARTTPVAVFNTTSKKFTLNPLGLGLGGYLSADLSHHDCYGYKSKLPDLAKLPRNSRGAIEAKFIPTRLSLEALQEALTAALKPRTKRPHPACGLFTAETRYQRPKKVSEAAVLEATKLRAEGFTWKVVADALGVGLESIKTAHKRMTSVQESPQPV